VKYLTDVLNDFLSLGKLEEGKISMSLEAFNIVAFLSEITEGIVN
jgi:two-component system sensor kinase FixL